MAILTREMSGFITKLTPDLISNLSLHFLQQCHVHVAFQDRNLKRGDLSSTSPNSYNHVRLPNVELLDDKFVLSSATMFSVICYRNNMKQIQ